MNPQPHTTILTRADLAHNARVREVVLLKRINEEANTREGISVETWNALAEVQRRLREAS